MTGAAEGPDDCAYIPTYGEQDEEKRQVLRKTKTAPRVRFYFEHLNKFIAGLKGPAPFTVLDIYAFLIFQMLTNAKMGGFMDAGEECFSNMAAVGARVMANPKVGPLIAKFSRNE
jgi:hypothetical protein